MMYKPDTKWSIKTENAHTVVKDNVADGLTNYSGTFPGINSGNVVGDPVRPMLQDPDNYDFRPKRGSGGDMAKGHGPYPDPHAKAWMPGRHGDSDRSEGSDVKTAQAFYNKLRKDARKSSEESFVV